MTKRESDFSPGEICVARALKKPTAGAYSHPRGFAIAVEELVQISKAVSDNRKFTPALHAKATDWCNRLSAVLGTYDPANP